MKRESRERTSWGTMITDDIKRSKPIWPSLLLPKA
jgi:hypothetical protein